MDLSGVSQVGINETFFVDNQGPQGGAICAKGDVSLAVTSSTFAGNSAENGGAIYLGL
jgi:predicted outer membrane repeat protein